MKMKNLATASLIFDPAHLRNRLPLGAEYLADEPDKIAAGLERQLDVAIRYRFRWVKRRVRGRMNRFDIVPIPLMIARQWVDLDQRDWTRLLYTMMRSRLVLIIVGPKDEGAIIEKVAGFGLPPVVMELGPCTWPRRRDHPFAYRFPFDATVKALLRADEESAMRLKIDSILRLQAPALLTDGPMTLMDFHRRHLRRLVGRHLSDWGNEPVMEWVCDLLTRDPSRYAIDLKIDHSDVSASTLSLRGGDGNSSEGHAPAVLLE